MSTTLDDLLYRLGLDDPYGWKMIDVGVLHGDQRHTTHKGTCINTPEFPWEFRCGIFIVQHLTLCVVSCYEWAQSLSILDSQHHVTFKTDGSESCSQRVTLNMLDFGCFASLCQNEIVEMLWSGWLVATRWIGKLCCTIYDFVWVRRLT